MDGFNNVLEGTRQYFMGVPKQVQGEGSGQPVWPASTSPPEEGTPAQSGAPAATSRPPSTAAAPPVPAETPSMAVVAPPRPPSEPLEPEPHIIHKATVMREAAEKRREMPDIEDEEEPIDNLSPPSHIIHKQPQPLPSPAPAQAAPSPSTVRPPSVATPSAAVPESQPELSAQYRPVAHRVQTPTLRPAEHFAPSRPPDPYSSSRPPESFRHYPYEASGPEIGRNSHVSSIASPQPVATSRNSPQTYARLSNSVPQHTANRLREAAVHNSPAQRYAVSVPQPPPPHNDRVPPIHHPQTPPLPKLNPGDMRSTAHMYPPMPQRRESSPYTRSVSQYDRHSSVQPRKYDIQQAYSGYRPTTPQPIQNQRIDTHHQVPYKHNTIDVVNTNYSSRPSERSPVPQAPHPHEVARLPSRIDCNTSRPVDSRSYNQYVTSGSTASRYVPSAPLPVTLNTTPAARSTYRTPTTHRNNYEYATSSSVPSSSVRSSTKTSFPAQQNRLTVSVTSIVNEMNQTKQKRDSPITGTSQANHLDQTKQKRESPLDLSVKTVKNSADSSTTQDDAVDSATVESKILLPLQPRPSSSRQIPPAGYIAGHKVDFAPNFSNQYVERTPNLTFKPSPPQIHPSVRYNGTYDSRRPVPEAYPAESHHVYAERNKYTTSVARSEYVPRIDINRPPGDQCPVENRIRDDRHFVIDERKRPHGPIVSNIPDKLVRYETWTSDSRIDRASQSTMRENKNELIRQRIYNYNNQLKYEAYQNEQKRSNTSAVYRDRVPHPNHGYPGGGIYPEVPPRELSQYHALYQDRNTPTNSRHHVIQRIPSHREVHPQHVDANRVPADKRVLSILRNSLETKQTGLSDAPRPSKQISELIVIDDADDAVVDIDLTKENDHIETKRLASPTKSSQAFAPNLEQHIQMPKAVDSLPRDSEYHKFDNLESKRNTPENDVARIRTKAELKVMPPSQDNGIKSDIKLDLTTETSDGKLLPKSQKQHLFNQIRKDNLRFESVIRTEKSAEVLIPDVKSEPMNIEEIERDAEISIKTENLVEDLNPERIHSSEEAPGDDLDWDNACENFVEQLKSGCHKKRSSRKVDEIDYSNENKVQPEETSQSMTEFTISEPEIVVKQEPLDEDEIKPLDETSHLNVEVKVENAIDDVIPTVQQIDQIEKTPPKTAKSNTTTNKLDKSKKDKKIDKEKPMKSKTNPKSKTQKSDSNSPQQNKKDKIKTLIKEELESTDDDEPLIKSKILKEKEHSERLKHQLLKDLSEKSAYVKLECCDVDVNKNNRKSLDSDFTKGKEEKQKGKITKSIPKTKGKSHFADSVKNDKQEPDSSTDSEDEKLSVASRLRLRKNVKNEDKAVHSHKTSPSKKIDSTSSTSSSSTPVRKPDFGDGSAFHPGWEEELYRYKRSLRMPSRLIAIPRGRSGGPFVSKSGVLITRGSTSLPDLDPAPLSPAPSSAPSAATDDLYARRPDKTTLDSDLDSNSSCSAPNRLHYDSEASTSTVFSTTKPTRKSGSIVDVLIQKCRKKEDNKKKSKDKDDKLPKVIPKTSNTSELLPTRSLELLKNCNKGTLSAKKEKLMEEIYYLGAFRKETVSAFRNTFIKDTDGLIGATEEFAPVVLKSRTRTESRVLKQRATIKEVFGDERPASAPPTSCRDIDSQEEKDDNEVASKIKKEPDNKTKFRPKKIIKDKLKRRSSSIRDGLRSTKSLKRNDAKGRLLRLKKRNNLIKSLNNKRIKDISNNKPKIEGTSTSEEKDKPKEESSTIVTDVNNTKRRIKRLFGKRKLSSGFDYIRKKKKIIRREDSNNKIRRPAIKPSPESIHDIQKEIKSWFINKSIGETHLHRAARLGYTDCVAYCLEKMESDPTAKDNAGFTPLHVAAAKGHVPIARLLLQYGANVSAAAQGGIRPLHEACENCHVEVIRLLLAYGADPLLGTYAGQTPEELTEGNASKFLQLHIADVQGQAIEPWRFPPPTNVLDHEEIGYDPLSSPPPASPPPPPDATIEIQCTEAPLPPFYSLKTVTGQPSDGLWCLLQDITNLLQIKSKDNLLKQIHCGSGSPKELLREIRTQEFLERAQCHQLLCAGEKVNIRASKVALVRVTDKLRQLLKIETVLVS